jgi:hypothetical protein
MRVHYAAKRKALRANEPLGAFTFTPLWHEVLVFPCPALLQLRIAGRTRIRRSNPPLSFRYNILHITHGHARIIDKLIERDGAKMKQTFNVTITFEKQMTEEDVAQALKAFGTKVAFEQHGTTRTRELITDQFELKPEDNLHVAVAVVL